MKIKAKLRQLTDADVRYISLVERGANRIPFRIVKTDSKENSMGIDLSKLGLRVAKSEPPKAAVAAFVLSKNDPALVAKAVESLKETGVEMSHIATFDDGSVAIASDDKFFDDPTVIRFSKEFGVVLKNFNDQNVVMKSCALGKDAELTGGFDGAKVALDYLSDQVQNILKTEGVDRAKQLKEVVADFYTYIDNLAAVPASVYKVAPAVSELVASFQSEEEQKEEVEKMACPEGMDKAKWDAMSPEEQKACAAKMKDGHADAESPKEDAADTTSEAEEDKKPTKKEEAAPVAEEKKDEVKPESAEKPAETVEKVDAPVKNQELDTVLQAVQSLTGTVGGLVETVQKLSTEVASVKKSTEEKLAEVTRKTETAERVLKGTVIGSTTPGDPDHGSTVVKKQDDDPRTGVFDTAFIRYGR
jgi:uncharacterized protein YoxC